MIVDSLFLKSFREPFLVRAGQAPEKVSVEVVQVPNSITKNSTQEEAFALSDALFEVSLVTNGRLYWTKTQNRRE